MRIFFIKNSEQVSFKKRNDSFLNRNELIYGNIGFFFSIFFLYNYFYSFFFKTFFKKLFISKYYSFSFSKIFYNLNSNLPCRKKSKNARMGKGIGVFFSWVSKIKSYKIFLEFIFFKNKKIFLFLFFLKKKVSKFVWIKI